MGQMPLLQPSEGHTEVGAQQEGHVKRASLL